ncbi:MAG: Crp/Fnr family transcriptional regulator [Ruminococcaceae bacterium]|nr:Crp/Fnr family transcriptional regulator [Oscillospiraceae bacterium]
MENYLPLLARTALFDGIGENEIRTLCETFRCRTAYYPKGSTILKRDETVDSAGLVLTGGVQAERNGAEGELRIVARHGALSLFGDVLAVSRRRKSPVDVVAVENTEVLFLPLGAIMRDEAPQCRAALSRLRMNLLGALADKYWALNDQLELLRAPSLRARLARRLLAERRRQGSDRFTLPGTRETLAAELCVNRSALSRELGRMQREGLLTARRGDFVIRDAEALRRAAGE